jgi:predicted Zn finger-like uncharacterized protein
MDVRCEKCQTEYELDEARLKPGGVTVKCTNCGHMFKIRKRSTTNVGAHPAVGGERPTTVAKAPTSAQRDAQPAPRDSTAAFDEPTRSHESVGEDRQWLIRLENGEQKSCKELAILQQWIVGGVVTRESLISRTGKTWKRIGDITELAQYFTIADEARNKRQGTAKPTPPPPQVPQTMLGVGPSAAGGTILPDDEDVDKRTTGNFRARGKTQPPPVPPKAQTPAVGTPAAKPPTPAQDTSAPDVALAATQVSTGPTRRPPTQPPPPPVPAKQEAERPKVPSVPAGNRATAAWATEGIAAAAADDKGPQGPLGGKIKVQTEQGFAGRVRVEPGESTAFQRGGKVTFEDDEEVMPARKGSKAGWIMLVVLLLAGGGAAAAYFLVLKGKDKPQTEQATAAPADAADVATSPPEAGVPPPTTIDAPSAPATGPLELARAELEGDRESKLREALTAISTSKEPGADALRAYLTGSIAQQLLDRATVTADRSEADKLKKEAKTVITDALGPAQKAVKAMPDDVTANLAMATVLRVQGKSARDLTKYLDAAKAKSTPETRRDIALAQALVLVRDNKLDDAKALLAPLDANEDKMETSGDVRVRLRLALIAYAQNKPDVAKPLVESVLAFAPDHVAAKTLSERLLTTVAKSDPLPPEDGEPNTGSGSGSGSSSAKPPGPGTNTGNTGGGTSTVAAPGDSYDKLLAKANTLAERSCTQALDLYAKALEQKPNGVEALTGMGYCHVDAKQFSAAYSKFRAALAISSRYEPALWGIAETYLQQGRKENALEAVKAYIEVHGETPKAKKALERLGASGGSGGGNSGGGSTTPTPTPTPPENGGGGGTPTPPAPTPAPTPTAPAEGASDGSG